MKIACRSVRTNTVGQWITFLSGRLPRSAGLARQVGRRVAVRTGQRYSRVAYGQEASLYHLYVRGAARSRRDPVGESKSGIERRAGSAALPVTAAAGGKRGSLPHPDQDDTSGALAEAAANRDRILHPERGPYFPALDHSS